MVSFDEKENDPNRFRNRGGGLLAEEREKKKVLHQLPKVSAGFVPPHLSIIRPLITLSHRLFIDNRLRLIIDSFILLFPLSSFLK